jgi:putative phosphoribosyl transferase
LLACEKESRIVPGATHLFEQPGTLGGVAGLAGEWFERHIARDANSRIRQNERDSHVVR